MDGTGVDCCCSDDQIDDANKEDDDMKDEVKIKISNVSALASIKNKISNNDKNNSIPLRYYQKLESKHKEIHDLIRTAVSKTQKKIAMN